MADPTQDPTQQQQDPSQLPSWLSRAGGAIGSGLTQALPYAVPAVLGAAMARGVGGGAALGALAGAGMAGGDIQEQQRTQQELDLQRQRLHIEAQEGDIEVQKGKVALQDDADRKAYAKTITDPDQRRLYLEDPSAFFQAKQWQNFSTVLSKDPTFSQTNPTLAKLLPQLGPSMGPKAVESALSGKYPNGHVTVNNPDGTTTVYGLGPNGEKTPIAHGITPKMLLAPGAVTQQDRQATAADTKATASVQKEYDAMRTANQKAAGVMTGLGLKQLPYPNLPDTFDDYLTSPEGQTAFGKVQQQLSAGRANANLTAKKGPVPPIPAGSKPVYDASGKLVGYKHD